MFYANDSGAYVVDSGGTCKSLGVSVKERSVTVTEVESVTTSERKEMSLPAGAVPASLAEIIAKFGVTQANPLVAQTDPVKASAPAAPSSAAVDPDAHKKDELLQMASELGIDVPSDATKADIAAAINGR